MISAKRTRKKFRLLDFLVILSKRNDVMIRSDFNCKNKENSKRVNIKQSQYQDA